MNPQTKELEIARKYMREWNERREAAERKGLERFYKLWELLRKEKQVKANTIN